MSIINDALKKVQENLEKDKTEQKDSTRSTDSNTPIAKDKNVSQNIKEDNKTVKKSLLNIKSVLSLFDNKKIINISSFIIILIILFLIIQSYFFKPYSRKKAINAKEGNITTNTKQSNELNISGIMVMDGKRIVLINNRIYETGDTVNGIKITNISFDSIEVMENGKAKKYKVN